MGALALLFALVGTIETIIDGIFTCYYLPEEVRKGELCHWEFHAPNLSPLDLQSYKLYIGVYMPI